MGKQSKLKKIRKSQLTESQPQSQIVPEQFVKNIEKQGYSLKKLERSPEIPGKRIEPQV
ncbi:hypothetical protein PCC7424_5197 [Gloeothece citriformis PCC 7424]|uniref:Uncharacterized protein n=1 Tax=Gloeothece citriformis (strain PCC 7424) TaxID=65393 RepID=B7KI59_GLOC7|nr:hypothetical protein [Gloeothece citriformis]ACK73546.1 hypothetical protein PCC7424_5197 [Gloeothece citriformis PCC 7424]